jgi:hypothetical protein
MKIPAFHVFDTDVAAIALSIVPRAYPFKADIYRAAAPFGGVALGALPGKFAVLMTVMAWT